MCQKDLVKGQLAATVGLCKVNPILLPSSQVCLPIA